MPLIDGGTYRLPQIVGLGRALDLILTGREIGAEEAERIGFVNRVVPDGEALPTAIALEARSVVPVARRGERPQERLRRPRAPEAEALAIEDELGRQTIFADGFREGVGQLRRPPSVTRPLTALRLCRISTGIR